MTSPIQIAVDDDGIAVVTFDTHGRSANAIDLAFTEAFIDMVDRLETDAAIRGAVLTSAKSTFVVGGDLNGLGELGAAGKPGAGGGRSARELVDILSRFPRALRKLETCGKPVVAALNGTAMGGGLEIALACHHRVVADSPGLKLGLPEVKVGLMPGAGGTQRLPRIIGIAEAAPLILQGKSISADKAGKIGLVEAVVPADRLIESARALLNASPRVRQPWDEKGFEVPGGSNILDLKWMGFYYLTTGAVQAQTLHNYPAPKAILSAIFEGCMLTIDAGLDIEIRYMASLFRSPVAGNMIRSLFINKEKADKLAFRPDAAPRFAAKTVGVLGAGMMGAGIAQVCADTGIDVVLLDQDQEAAERGKAGIAKRLARQIEKGRISQEKLDGLLDRIQPTADYARLSGCDLIVEAVFEDPTVKAKVTQAAEAVTGPKCIFATNTSTLRISELAKASSRPDRFIGLHFFSPVDRMPLVEIITGPQTSEATLARSMDFVQQIRKTPIVVTDSWGFYTSRCFATFTAEGMAMLEDGIKPALIENAARLAGMPVGPLTVQDEVSLELSHHVQKSLRTMLGDAYRETAADRVIARMVEGENRRGRKDGKGFYDYPGEGAKRLWPGLADVFPLTDPQPDIEDLKQRFLYRQALEAARCLEEGVLTRPQDADIGALLGWGFPSYTGGPIALIDTVGTSAFVSRCERYADRLGPRFSPPESLRKMAETGASYYSRAA